MRAAVLDSVGRIRIVETEEPCPASDEVLVRMRAVGICGSDRHAFQGHHPFRRPPVVLGHEGAGLVAQVAPGGRLRVGDRVAIMPVLSCWDCRLCEVGLSHLCPHKRVPGVGWQGLLTEYVVAPERVLFPLADDISYGEGAMVEPVAVAWHTNQVGGVVFGDSLAVLGAGAIGTLVACVARLRGVGTLVVSDLVDARLRRVQELTGASVVNPSRADVVREARGLAGGEGFDVVVLASGHPSCMDEALALCRPRGTIVVLPMFEGPVMVNLNPAVLGEAVIRGSTIYTPADFRAAVDVVNRRVLDVRPLLAEPLPLERTQRAFEMWEANTDAGKVQIDPAR
ncbi:alcohol dehydrogenase catalytic domain-containing protein [Actinopolymorpha pittospori]|uniref:2-desacetyl-2-hydroxyethyl bacteriochlorophyllide A dehydrogenase n=1 Tax=Actinopolymorpha pittospori TaxID=648752 RepID=A0A927RB50_9ACTN|nr:2-desacetyl-2-hydroxyethyl bacteriochlorophyllide A dehydrogenase [Actinopolymorpha pittospori]